MQSRNNMLGFGVILVVMLGAVSCGARPRAENTYGDMMLDNGPQIEDALASGNGIGRGEADHLLAAGPEDNALAAALQIHMLQQIANYKNMRSLPWEQMLRAPQEKRQIRYRQCYFNPISCFRK